MGVVLGLLVALSIAAADLFGRRLTKVNGPVATGAVLQIVATIASLAALGAVDSVFAWRDVALGALSGFGLAGGLGCYLAGLDRSSSAIISPLAATGSAGIPFAYAVATGSDPSTTAVVGSVLAIGGIILITTGGNRATHMLPGVQWGSLSGASYGFGLTVLIEVSAESGVWSAVSQRFVAAVVMGAVAIVMGSRIAPPVGLRLAAIAGGVAVALSTVFYLLAVDANVVAAVVTSSTYPIGTVAIGRTFFGDTVRARQVVGVLVTVAGVAAIAAG